MEAARRKRPGNDGILRESARRKPPKTRRIDEVDL
jgi:hypothetical protein